MRASLHLYYGDGKGKTTSAVGLAVRAQGAKLRVAFIQFLKDGSSSEIRQLKQLGITCFAFGDGKFYRKREIPNNVRESCREALAKAAKLADSYDLIVLDEALTALGLGAISQEEMLELVNLAKCELVLTGREAPEQLIARADYVTFMKKIKHPYDTGKQARYGIEF